MLAYWDIVIRNLTGQSVSERRQNHCNIVYNSEHNSYTHTSVDINTQAGTYVSFSLSTSYYIVTSVAFSPHLSMVGVESQKILNGELRDTPHCQARCILEVAVSFFQMASVSISLEILWCTWLTFRFLCKWARSSLILRYNHVLKLSPCKICWFFIDLSILIFRI